MTETVHIRAKTRRVKDYILSRFLELADRVNAGEILRGSDKELYEQLMFTFARNVLPRSQEIGGDPDNRTPIPILANVHSNNGNSKDSQTPETDSGSSGRDSSEQDSLDTSPTD